MSVRNREASQSAKLAMDSRKFLSMINNSAQSQVTFFENAVRKLGEKRGADWDLTALLNGKLVIEDKKTGEYMVAEHARQKGGRIVISNVQKIDIHEGKKGEIFESSCRELIDAIETGDSKRIDTAFNKISASRFRSTVIPESGMVRTKDGVIRRINLNESDNRGVELGKQILDALTDQITLNEDGQISGTFVEDLQIEFPSTRLIGRKLVAHHMRERALNSYWSDNFQSLVESIAGYISNNKLVDAVQHVGGFLRENQEFSLLTREQLNETIGNALAAKGILNEELVDDTTTLFYKTGLKVNKEDIVDAWQKTATLTEDPIILEHAKALTEADDFANSYEKFLYTFFEATGSGTQRVLMLALQQLRDKVDGVEGVDVEEIDDLITKLGEGADKETEIRAMEVVKTVDEGLGIMSDKGLDDFDQFPGDIELDKDPAIDAPIDDVVDTGTGDSSGSHVTNITINTGGGESNVQKSGESEQFDIADLPVEELDLDDVDEVEDIDDGDDDSEKEVDIELEGTDKGKSKIIKEAEGIVKELMEESDEDEEEEEEDSDDPFSLPKGLEKPEVNKNYSSPKSKSKDSDINEEVDVDNIRRKMTDLGIGEDDADGIHKLAEAYVSGKYKDQDDAGKRKRADELTGKVIGNHERLSEDQHKSPLRQLAKRGLKRSAINKLVKEGKLQFTVNEGVVDGEFKGIPFSINYRDGEAILTNIEGSEVPIPEEFVQASKYITEMSDEEIETDSFVEWLDANIDQLEVIEESVDQELEEAIARISVTPEGHIDMEADTDDVVGDLDVEPSLVDAEPVDIDPMSDLDFGPPLDEFDDEFDNEEKVVDDPVGEVGGEDEEVILGGESEEDEEVEGEEEEDIEESADRRDSAINEEEEDEEDEEDGEEEPIKEVSRGKKNKNKDKDC